MTSNEMMMIMSFIAPILQPITPRGFAAVRAAIDKMVGLGNVQAVHVNDSKRPLGCRVDRHEGIGQGEMGLTPFRLLVRDPVLGRLPLILETPKGKAGEDLDAVNLAILRGFSQGGSDARA